jgi:hypothetical protein
MLDDNNQGRTCFWTCFRILLFGFFALTMMGAGPGTNQQSTKDVTQDKLKPPSEVTEPDLDAAHWSVLKNKYGWKIKFPETWVHDEHAEDVFRAN